MAAVGFVVPGPHSHNAIVPPETGAVQVLNEVAAALEQACKRTVPPATNVVPDTTLLIPADTTVTPVAVAPFVVDTDATYLDVPAAPADTSQPQPLTPGSDAEPD